MDSRVTSKSRRSRSRESRRSRSPRRSNRDSSAKLDSKSLGKNHFIFTHEKSLILGSIRKEYSNRNKVEKIQEDNLDLIPSPSVKIQIIGGKV